MDNAEFFEALKLLQKEKGIEGDYLAGKDPRGDRDRR